MATCRWIGLTLGAALWAAGVAQAQEVTRAMPNGYEAVASYAPGAGDKPAVVLLHGFLQTKHFHTVARLARGLRDQGYAVLRPTLTLQVPRRRESLSCDAVHAHRMDEDLAEVAAWVRFMRQRGHDRVVLFGHSYGGVQAVAAATRSLPGVIGVVGVSLADVEHNFGDSVAGTHARRAMRQARRGAGGVHAYALSHCQQYPAPVGAYLSYVRWDRTRILEAVRGIDVPVRAIVGGADERMGADWPAKLEEAGATVQRVPGADHFFDAMHEFDLIEAALAALAALEDEG